MIICRLQVKSHLLTWTTTSLICMWRTARRLAHWSYSFNRLLHHFTQVKHFEGWSYILCFVVKLYLREYFVVPFDTLRISLGWAKHALFGLLLGGRFEDFCLFFLHAIIICNDHACLKCAGQCLGPNLSKGASLHFGSVNRLEPSLFLFRHFNFVRVELLILKNRPIALMVIGCQKSTFRFLFKHSLEIYFWGLLFFKGWWKLSKITLLLDRGHWYLLTMIHVLFSRLG